MGYFILFDHLIVNCIFKKYSNLQYLHLMIKDVLKVILRVNLGTEEYDFENVLVSINFFRSVIFSRPFI